MGTEKAKHEIEHGKYLAEGDTELIWGWGTPAGKIRAKRRAELIRSGACLKPGMRVLEIGCGTGMFTEMFAESGAQIIAVDISPDLLKIAKERNLTAERVLFKEARFEECAVDGPFDAIIGSSILHHLDIEPSLDKIFELLNPGGYFSFAEPNWLNPQNFITFKFRSFFPHISPDENPFIRWDLASKLSKTGFQNVNITPFDWLHPQTPVICIDIVKKLGKLFEQLPAAREFAGSILINAMRPAAG